MRRSSGLYKVEHCILCPCYIKMRSVIAGERLRLHAIDCLMLNMQKINIKKIFNMYKKAHIFALETETQKCSSLC